MFYPKKILVILLILFFIILLSLLYDQFKIRENLTEIHPEILSANSTCSKNILSKTYKYDLKLDRYGNRYDYTDEDDSDRYNRNRNTPIKVTKQPSGGPKTNPPSAYDYCPTKITRDKDLSITAHDKFGKKVRFANGVDGYTTYYVQKIKDLGVECPMLYL